MSNGCGRSCAFRHLQFPHNPDRTPRHSVPLQLSPATDVEIFADSRTTGTIPASIRFALQTVVGSSRNWIGAQGSHTPNRGVVEAEGTLPRPFLRAILASPWPSTGGFPVRRSTKLLLPQAWFATRRRAHRGRTHHSLRPPALPPNLLTTRGPVHTQRLQKRAQERITQLSLHHSFQFQKGGHFTSGSSISSTIRCLMYHMFADFLFGPKLATLVCFRF